MSETPEYLRKLREEVNQASDRFVKATAEWEKAKEAIKKHPWFVLTGERRSPKRGEDFLGEVGNDEDKPTRAYSDFLPDVPRFILRRVKEEAEEEGFVHCSKCGKRVSNTVPGNLFVRAYVECPDCIEKEPDPPEPRVVWACPGEVLQLIEEIYHSNYLLDSNQQSRFRRLDQLCRSTREATVEEIDGAIVGADHVDVKCSHFPNRVRYEIDLSSKKLQESLNSAGIRLVKEE